MGCISLVNLNRNTVNKYYNFLREVAVNSLTDEKLSGVIEINESYSGAKRIKEKRGRDGKIFAQVVRIVRKSN